MIGDTLIRKRPVEIWVAAHVGNSSCTSPRRSVELQHIGTGCSSHFTQQHVRLKHATVLPEQQVSWAQIDSWISFVDIKHIHKIICIFSTVKHDIPQNITMSWLKNNLSLSWSAAEEYPALAEVRFRRHEHPTDSWETVRQISLLNFCRCFFFLHIKWHLNLHHSCCYREWQIPHMRPLNVSSVMFHIFRIFFSVHSASFCVRCIRPFLLGHLSLSIAVLYLSCGHRSTWPLYRAYIKRPRPAVC